MRYYHRRQLGIGDFKAPQDIFVADSGEIYILDSGNGRIVQLSKERELVRIIDGFVVSGQMHRFSQAKGLFVTDDGHIYIADTLNERVVHLDEHGDLVQIIGAPKSPVEGIIPDSFRYRPIRLVVDSSRRIYVVAEGQAEGILQFTPDGEFLGFFGSPRVTPSLADVIWSRLATREQRERLALFLPTEHSSIDLDERGFFFTTIAAGDIVRTEPIRRLSPSGQSVTRRLGFTDPVGDPQWIASRFCDVVARPGGLYSALDQTRGRVFTYDSSGYLLYVFGCKGKQAGAIDVPRAIEQQGSYILVVDEGTNEVKVYKPTQYATLIHTALYYYQWGNYEDSARAWEAVLHLNANYDRAYCGIGLSHLLNGRLEDALRYFRLGNDRAMYSKAYRLYRRDVVDEHLGKVLTVALVIAGMLVFAVRCGVFARLWRLIRGGYDAADKAMQQRARPLKAVWNWLKTTARGVFFALYVIIHPFDGFWCLKHEKRGSVPSALVILLMTLASFIVVRQYTGFVLNPRDLRELNIYREASGVLVPFALWCVINWALTTLVDGKGTIRDMLISSSYALTPLIIIYLPATFLSNFLVAEEGSLYYLILAVGAIWAGAMLFIGTMVTHDYSAATTLFTSVLTVAGILAAVFIGAFWLVLMDQMVAFIGDLYTEIALRL